jgi:hypothetical protein
VGWIGLSSRINEQIGIVAGFIGIFVGLLGLYLNSIPLHQVTWDDITFDFFDGRTFEIFIFLFIAWSFSMLLYFMSFRKTPEKYAGILAGCLSFLTLVTWAYQYLIVRQNAGSLNSENYGTMVSLLELGVLALGLSFILGGIVLLSRMRSDKISGLTGFSLLLVGCFGVVLGLRGIVPGFTFFDWYWIPFFAIISVVPSLLLVVSNWKLRGSLD